MDYRPGSQSILVRNKIHRQLEQIFSYPLTLVVAAMGYGKTVTVKSYLEANRIDYVWVTVESAPSSVHRLWDYLARQFGEFDPDMGDTLTRMGFPMEAEQRERMVDLLEEWAFLKEKVLVIDDYHYANSHEMDLFIELIVRRKINGLYLIILSRTRPSIHVQELTVKGLCHQVQSSLFELSTEEIKEYFLFFGLNISDDMARKVQEITEGWATAVYLVCQNYIEQGILRTGVDMNELIESAILKRYSERERKLLMKLSILNRFSAEQAVFVTNDESAAGDIQRMSRDNSFLRFDPRSERYAMHNIFASYLMSHLEDHFEKNELMNLYQKCGEWFFLQNLMLPGIAWLLRSKAFDRIMEHFEKPGITRMLSRLPAQEIVSLFEQIPLQTRYLHPMGYITYIDFYISRVDIEEGARLLDNVEKFIQGYPGFADPDRNRMEGEIELVKMYMEFNDLRKMADQYKKAHFLLDGRSRIANPDMIFTFGCPSTLFLYHRSRGDLANRVIFADMNYHFYEELSGGCGKGYEDLIMAEYFLEIGNMEKAELHAYKSIYKAETMDQISLILNASFVLSRMYAAQGRIQEAQDRLHELSTRISDYKSPILLNAVDLCYGYLGGITGDTENFARWIQRGSMKKEEMFYHGFTFYYLVRAKHLLLHKDFIKLEVICSEMLHSFPEFNMELGYVHAHILDAIAKSNLYSVAQGREALKLALDIGREDNLVLPFAEYAEYIADIVSGLIHDYPSDEYLAKIAEAAIRYKKNLQRFWVTKSKKEILSDREKEIVKLMADGYHNKEIAEKLYIAEITVKKTITSIYRKLGVGSRAAAVRKVVEDKIILE